METWISFWKIVLGGCVVVYYLMAIFLVPVAFRDTIVPEKNYGFKITNVRARNGKYIDYQLEEVKGTQGTAYALTVENLRTEPGRYSDMIILETDSEIRRNVNVRVYGILRKRPEQE